MSRSALVIVLSEDKMQQQLVNRYLRRRGFSHHEIRVQAPPVGQSQNVTYVLEQYAIEVSTLRKAAASHALIVVIDADENTVEARKAQLDAALREAGKDLRADSELIAIVVPRRNIETWVWYLENNTVDEQTDYKNHPVRSHHDLGTAKVQFADYIITGQEPFPGCPPSLQDARSELLRVPHQ